jgi:hypothetical protein
MNASVNSQHILWDETDGREWPDGGDNVALDALGQGQYINPQL